MTQDTMKTNKTTDVVPLSDYKYIQKEHRRLRQVIELLIAAGFVTRDKVEQAEALLGEE